MRLTPGCHYKAITKRHRTSKRSDLDFLISPFLHFWVLGEIVDSDVQHAGDGDHSIEEKLEQEFFCLAPQHL